MENALPSVCPYCGETDIGIGYQLGAGALYADAFAYHASGECCGVEHLLCKAAVPFSAHLPKGRSFFILITKRASRSLVTT